MKYVRADSMGGIAVHAALCCGLLVLGAGPSRAQQTTIEPQEPEIPRLGGLKTGRYGLSEGPGGGLTDQVKRNGKVPSLKPLPPGMPEPAADPRNFEGNWSGDQYLDAWEVKADQYGNWVPFNATGRAVMDKRLLANDGGSPYITPAIVCRSAGPVRDMIRSKLQFFQSPDMLNIVSSANRTWWQIPLDEKLAEAGGTSPYMGRSVGHWDGNTLVIETSGFAYRLYLAFRGTPLSTKGKITTRVRKVHEDRWFLEVVSTVDDPTFYSRPWSFVRTFSWRPDYAQFSEYNCEHQIGDPGNKATAGYTREPDDY